MPLASGFHAPNLSATTNSEGIAFYERGGIAGPPWVVTPGFAGGFSFGEYNTAGADFMGDSAGSTLVILIDGPGVATIHTTRYTADRDFGYTVSHLDTGVEITDSTDQPFAAGTDITITVPDDGFSFHHITLFQSDAGAGNKLGWSGFYWAGGVPVVPTGYDVHEIVPPGDTIEFVGTLDDGYNRAIRPVRNEPGSGTFTINRYSANATAAIIKPGNLVKVCIPEIDPNYIFSWFMETGDFTLVSSSEEGGEDITIAGRGALSYWDRVVWLSEKFVIPWWDGAWGTPPTGARGHVTFVAGTYRHYTIAGGVITGYTDFTTAGFEAYFDSRQTYDWPSAGSKRFLVHLMTGETHAGWYVHPHQDGVTETLPTYAVGTSTSVLLSDISPDTPGAILYRLWQEGTDAARPDQPIPLMTVDFTATLDSNGDAWATTDALAGLTAELGETYLDTIAKLLSTGVIDVEMGPDLDMHAYNSQGVDRSATAFGAGKVRFVKGVNIADELRRELSDTPVATFVEVVGTDNVIGRAVLPDAASRVAREISATGDSNVEATLEAIGLALLNARLISSDAIGFRIAVGDDDATGLYLPGPAGTAHGDFWLGDLTTLHTGAGEQDFNNEDERVYAITIAEDEAGNLDVTPEVGSVLGEAERRLYAGASSSPGSTSFVTRSQFTDTAVAETSTDVDVHIADTSDAHDASAISVLDTGGYFTGTDVEAALAELGAGTGGAGLPWFNVTTYGAVGDGTTNDTSAVNAAIAALNTAGRGVLYFPAGTYKCTAALTAITAAAIIRGDGMSSYDGTVTGSQVNCTSQTANLFTINSKIAQFEHIALANTYAGTPSAGAGIYVTSADQWMKVDYESVLVRGFYDNVVIAVGSSWTMHNCYIIGPVRYGVDIDNSVNHDVGDWAISDCAFFDGSYAATAAIRAGNGGCKVINTKIVAISGGWQIGIDWHYTAATVILLVTNCSIENTTVACIRVNNLLEVTIDGNELVAQTGNAILMTNVGRTFIGSNTYTSWIATALFAVDLTSCDYVTVGPAMTYHFAGPVQLTTCTNVLDFSTPAGGSLTVKDEGSALATAATSLDFVGAGVVASGTGAAKTITIAGTAAATSSELMIADGHSTPPVFADILFLDDNSDFLYSG